MSSCLMFLFFEGFFESELSFLFFIFVFRFSASWPPGRILFCCIFEPLFIFESSFGFYLYIGITFPFLWLQYSIDFLFFQYVILAKLLYSHLCNRENLAFISQKALTLPFVLWYDWYVERFNFEPLFVFTPSVCFASSFLNEGAFFCRPLIDTNWFCPIYYFLYFHSHKPYC